VLFVQFKKQCEGKGGRIGADGVCVIPIRGGGGGGGPQPKDGTGPGDKRGPNNREPSDVPDEVN
jgi:hypothetical protein